LFAVPDDGTVAINKDEKMPLKNKLVIGSLANRGVATFVQAMDNQWAPRKVLQKIAQGQEGRSRKDFDANLIRLAKYEYRRALLNSKYVLVNRASIFNSRAFYGDVLQPDNSEDPQGRAALEELFSQGSLIPFLFFEGAIDEIPKGFTTDHLLVQVWLSICKNADIDVMRLSWDEKTNKEEVTKVSRRFHTLADQLIYYELAPLADHLDLSLESSGLAFKKRLRDLRGELDRIMTSTDKFATREQLYEKFVVKDGSKVAAGEYDCDKPFALEIKQILDAIYVSGLPEATATQIFNASDSMGASVIQRMAGHNRESFTEPSKLVAILRNLVFSDIIDTLNVERDVFDLSELSLPDVVKLRNRVEWKAYVDDLDGILRFNGAQQIARLANSPGEFQMALLKVLQSYLGLLAHVRAALEPRSYAELAERATVGHKTAIRISLLVADMEVARFVADPCREDPFVAYEEEEKLRSLGDTPLIFSVKLAQVASPYHPDKPALNETTCLRGVLADAQSAIRDVVGDLIAAFPGQRLALKEQRNSGPDTVTAESSDDSGQPAA